MNESYLQAFIHLIKFDQSILVLEKNIGKATESIQSHEQELAKQRAYRESLGENVKNLKRQVELKELEMSSLSESEKKKRAYLEQVAHTREVQSVFKEVEALRKAQHDLEEGLLEAWQKLESAKTELLLRNKEYQEKSAAIETAIAQEMQTIEHLKHEIRNLSVIREEKMQNIPEQWLEKYIAMRDRVSNPVVPVLQGSCSACFYHIIEQDLMRLKNRAVLECKDCHRLLYFE